VNTIDYTINCSQCGKKICGVSLTYFGVPHNSSPVACCLKCLPKRLDELEKQHYNPKVIKTFREWLKEETA
jgi:hypothetical protein